MKITLAQITQNHFPNILRYVSKHQNDSNKHPVASKFAIELKFHDIKGSGPIQKWNEKGYFQQVILLLAIYNERITQSLGEDKVLMGDTKNYITQLLDANEHFTAPLFDIHHYYFIKLARYIIKCADELHGTTTYLASEKRGFALDILRHLETIISSEKRCSQNFAEPTLALLGTIVQKHEVAWKHHKVANRGRLGDMLAHMCASRRFDSDKITGNSTPLQAETRSFDTTSVQTHVSTQLANLPRWAFLRKQWLQELLDRPSAEAYEPELTRWQTIRRNVSAKDIAKTTCILLGIAVVGATLGALISCGVAHQAALHALETWFKSLSAPQYAEVALAAVGGAGLACFAYQHRKVAYQCQTILEASSEKSYNPLI